MSAAMSTHSIFSDRRLTPEELEMAISAIDFHRFSGTTLIVCCVKLKNETVITGQSICAARKKFDWERGRRHALQLALTSLESMSFSPMQIRRLRK